MAADWSMPKIPKFSVMLFGADPGWSPAKEGIQGKRTVTPRDECKRCGGEIILKNRAARPLDSSGRPIPDALREMETAVHICGSCMRSTYEPSIARLPHKLYDPDEAIVPATMKLDADTDADGRTAEAVKSRRPAKMDRKARIKAILELRKDFRPRRKRPRVKHDDQSCSHIVA